MLPILCVECFVFWIIGLLIAFWGVPLLVMIGLGLACLLSVRLRTAVSRMIGLSGPGTPAPNLSRAEHKQSRDGR